MWVLSVMKSPDLDTDVKYYVPLSLSIFTNKQLTYSD